MTIDPGEQHDMVVDSVHFGSKSVQARVVLLFDKKANPQLNQFLIDNAGNPIASWFGPIQGSLDLIKKAASNGVHADEPDAEIADMIVNGEPAKVRRPRKSTNGNGATSEPEDLELPEQYAGMDRTAAGNAFKYAPHLHEFIQHHADNRCWLCGYWDAHEYHTGIEEERPWSDDDELLPHAYRPSANGRCRWCYLDPTNELHGDVGDDAEDGNAIDEMAQNLIDSIVTPAQAVGAAEGA